MIGSLSKISNPWWVWAYSCWNEHYQRFQIQDIHKVFHLQWHWSQNTNPFLLEEPFHPNQKPSWIFHSHCWSKMSKSLFFEDLWVICVLHHFQFPFLKHQVYRNGLLEHLCNIHFLDLLHNLDSSSFHESNELVLHYMCL